METKQYLAMYNIELINSTNNIVLYFIGSNCYQIKGHGKYRRTCKERLYKHYRSYKDK